MIADIWSKLSSEPDFNEFKIKVIAAPSPDIHTISTCRKLCRQNRCGSFNRNWGCPPGAGTDEDCLWLIHEYHKAVVISRKFDDANMKDLDFIDKSAHRHQDMIRKMSTAMKKAGYKDVLPLSDGGCKYCGECSYPDEPCRFPDQMIPSVSGFGIIMEEYLGSQGIDFKFEDDAFTLYGLILF
ncbi:MAG: DUF2284 domain-containing protein [Candidatus Methanogranum gryphiswaldense]|nr:MAG: DUF2284 domain-containing protein [Candidatus Methanogranum sp. U3.2.1]